jgi:hypothetical protein
MRGRPFELRNTSGRGRPRGSPNKKSLVLQKLLLEQGGEIIQTLIDRAKKGDRTALTLSLERLIPVERRSGAAPGAVARRSSITTNQHTETHKLDLSGLQESRTDDITN